MRNKLQYQFRCSRRHFHPFPPSPWHQGKNAPKNNNFRLCSNVMLDYFRTKSGFWKTYSPYWQLSTCPLIIYVASAFGLPKSPPKPTNICHGWKICNMFRCNRKGMTHASNTSSCARFLGNYCPNIMFAPLDRWVHPKTRCFLIDRSFDLDHVKSVQQ